MESSRRNPARTTLRGLALAGLASLALLGGTSTARADARLGDALAAVNGTVAGTAGGDSPDPVAGLVQGVVAPVIGVVAEPVAVVIQPAAQVVAPVVEPVAVGAEPLTTAVATTVEPVTAAVTDPVAAIAGPVAEAVEPVATAAAPIRKAVEPVAKAVKPVTKPLVPVPGGAGPPGGGDPGVPPANDPVEPVTPVTPPAVDPVAPPQPQPTGFDPQPLRATPGASWLAAAGAAEPIPSRTGGPERGSRPRPAVAPSAPDGAPAVVPGAAGVGVVAVTPRVDGTSALAGPSAGPSPAPVIPAEAAAQLDGGREDAPAAPAVAEVQAERDATEDSSPLGVVRRFVAAAGSASTVIGTAPGLALVLALLTVAALVTPRPAGRGTPLVALVWQAIGQRRYR